MHSWPLGTPEGLWCMVLLLSSLHWAYLSHTSASLYISHLVCWLRLQNNQSNQDPCQCIVQFSYGHRWPLLWWFAVSKDILQKMSPDHRPPKWFLKQKTSIYNTTHTNICLSTLHYSVSNKMDTDVLYASRTAIICMLLYMCCIRNITHTHTHTHTHSPCNAHVCCNKYDVSVSITQGNKYISMTGLWCVWYLFKCWNNPGMTLLIWRIP